MNRKRLKKLCDDVLCAIKSGETDCIEKTINTIVESHKGKRVNKSVYPDLNKFQFTQDDLNELRNTGVIDGENKIMGQAALNYVIKKKDPFLKLLYGQCWKRVELKKLHNILDGVQDMLRRKRFDEDRENFVFYQFGRHITRSLRPEPLIDRHSMRAFRILRRLKKIKAGKEKQGLTAIRRMFLVDNPQWVLDYVRWFNAPPKRNPKFRRAVDELLMVAGRAMN
jgi:hypothetical protein